MDTEAPVVVGVIGAVHVEDAPVPAPRMHVPAGVNVTVPVGAPAPVVAVSVTVAVHWVESPMVIVDGVQLTVVLVGLAPTVTVTGVLVLTAWIALPW